MARTKASVGAKMSSGKSSKARCCAPPPPRNVAGSSGTSERSRESGGNPVCPRETPKWQKPITNFFICTNTSREENGTSDSEGSPEKQVEPRASKRNIIYSDDEDSTEETPGASTDIDLSIHVEPLNGESSHNPDEYCLKDAPKGKGKGIGKKSSKVVNGKDRRNSTKRDLEDITFGEEPSQATKRVKVDC